MKANQWVAIAMAVLSAFAYMNSGNTGGGGGNGPAPVGTTAIAEAVHRTRASQQAALYRDIAMRVRNGSLVDAAAAGTELVRRITEIEQETAKPLSADAAANLPSGAWDDKEKAAKWFEAAASGFERVAK